MKLRIREVELYERPVHLRLPFRFGVVTLRDCPQAFVRARIEAEDGRSEWGAAAEMMAPKWFDKNLELTNEQNFDQLRDVLRLSREAYLSDSSAATAFGHFARNHDVVRGAGDAEGFNPLLSSYGPALIDRAVLDALCRLEGVSFYDAMHANLAGIGAERREFAGFDFGGFLASLQPSESIEARHTVGMLDAITAADLQERVNDGLPETLQEVIAAWGHRFFKLKVGGNLQADIARLEAIAAVLDKLSHPYFVSLDGNEQYADAAGVAELCAAIRGNAKLKRLWKSVLFIEQPIARKVALDVDLRDAKLGKVVIIDESDGELDTFVRARDRGYAGVSSKTCKGFYKSILNAARCFQWGNTSYFMSAEDLTTQAGLSVQQDLALVNLLGIRHVERNGHYYVNGLAAQSQQEQEAFFHAHPDVYEQTHGAVRLKIRYGRIALGSLARPGFASRAMPDFASMSRI
jgi:hypothetical protein